MYSVDEKGNKMQLTHKGSKEMFTAKAADSVKSSFWDKNKGWIIAVLIGLVILVLAWYLTRHNQ